MADEPRPENKGNRKSLWDRLDRFLIKGQPIEAFENDDAEDGGEFKLKPGWTIKG